MMMGRPRNILSAMIAAAIQKMRASAELSNESGIKERAASCSMGCDSIVQ
jgi:hypothetical protein